MAKRPEIPEAALKALKGRRVLCGFSGGADSSALLLVLHELSKEGLLSVEAVHFDHGLRGDESAADAKWCRAFCKARGVPFICQELKVNDYAMPGEGVEAAARRLRIDAWRKLAKRRRAVIALGHNAGDRVENLLLRLFRGSNASGLTSMRLIQTVEGALFVRPLLETPRKELEAYLEGSGASVWRNDSSNDETVFKRNFLRKEAIPMIAERMPYAVDGMRHSLKALEDDASFIEETAKREWERLSKLPKMPLEEWQKLHSAIRVRLLRYRISKGMGADFIPDAKLIERFNEEILRPPPESGRRLIPLKDTELFISIDKEGTCVISKIQEEPPEPSSWAWRESPAVSWGAFKIRAETVDSVSGIKDQGRSLAFFDADALPDSLLLSAWSEGERMKPFGRKSDVKLKSLFSKARVSSEARASHPVVRLPDGTPIWLPDVARSNYGAVGPATRKAVLFSAEKTR